MSDSGDSLREQEAKLLHLWSRVFPLLEADPGLVWTDEVMDKLKSMKKEEEKILFILSRMEERYDFYKDRDRFFREALGLVQELIRHINNIEASETWISHINADIRRLIEDLEKIGNGYVLIENGLVARVKQVFGHGVIENLAHSQLGRIDNFSGQSRTVKVITGSGAVVEDSSEIFTDSLMGCVAVFIFGPKGKALLHMTPSTKLPYEKPYLKDTMYQVNDALNCIGGKDCIVVILGTLYGKFGYKRAWEEWEEIQSEFKRHGIKQSKIVEMPLEKVTLYHTGLDANFIYIHGRMLVLDKDGSLMSPNKMGTFRIPIDPDMRIDFGIKR